MSTPRLKTVPSQSTAVYKLLSQSEKLTARQIADELGILPNTVYRAAKPLVELGMAEQTNDYPVSFRARPNDTAMNWYLRAVAKSFRQDFGHSDPKPEDDSLPTITFIKDRKQLLAIGKQEARNAKKTIDYIVSGHRIPDSTVLAYRKATTTGVKIRCIVQNTPKTTNASMEMYEDMGAEVRYLPNIGIRLFIFDSRTALLVSYDETQSTRAFGIRFTYAPVAKQLEQLFEQRWLQAKPLA